MFKCQILDGHNEVESRTGTNRTTGEVTQYFNQFAYVILPDSPFPQKMKVPVASPALAYPVGDYKIDPRCIHIGNFDSLSINSFNLKLIRENSK